MRHYIVRLFVSLVTFILGVSVASLGPAQPSGALANSEAKQEILQLEREYVDAHLRGDAETLDRILADDFSFRHRGGRSSDKAQRLALMETPGFEFLSIDTDGVDIDVDGDRAYVTGRAVTTSLYQARKYVSRPYKYLRVYEKREGRWQMVSVRASRSDWD
ncbi:MAG: nuclear transport factor 2 family protein [Pyrinomonadaceae bacterium]